MLNRLLVERRPPDEWDVVDPAYAARYAEGEWATVDLGLVDRLEADIGPLANKQVLDLGGGPGQFSVAFAERGADVTWHDPSRAYMDITRAKAAERGVQVNLSLGYLEDAKQLPAGSFDLVFNRICWAYCTNDRAFADLLYGLVRVGGAGFVDSHRFPLTGLRRVADVVNRATGIKLAHVPPPPGRIERLLRRHPLERLVVDDGPPENDRLLFVRGPAV